jgi:hypothetical protein
MPGHGEKLTRKKEQAIAALLTAPSITEAAATVGLAEKTLRLWLRDRDFIAGFREARRQVVETAIARLQHASNKAVDALERNLNCGHPGAEIRAALGILDNAIKAVELMDLAGRLEDLEANADRQPVNGIPGERR